MLNRDIVLLSLFGGIEGFALGFKNAGYNLKTHYYSEIDKYASAVTRYRFKDSIHVGSVTDVRGAALKRPDVITFGSPCQDFSLAGKRAGMEGERSSLILEAIRLISETRPSVFIWENVKGAFSSNAGADFWAILQEFTNIGGYRFEWQLLNTKWLLPQNRERIYLVGHLAEAGSRQVFPIGEDDKVFICNKESISRDIQAEDSSDIANCITSRYYKMGRTDNYIKTLSGSDVLNTIRSSTRGSMTEKHSWDIVRVKSNTKKGFEELHEGDSLNYSQPSSRPRRGRVGKGVAQTLDTATNQATLQNERIRRLTEIECERLQGFPDDWTQYGDFGNCLIKEISATQRYKMCGNAVTVDVVKTIAERL